MSGSQSKNKYLFAALVGVLALNMSWWQSGSVDGHSDMASIKTFDEDGVRSFSKKSSTNSLGLKTYYTRVDSCKESGESKMIGRTQSNSDEEKVIAIKKGDLSIRKVLRARISTSRCKLLDGQVVEGIVMRSFEVNSNKCKSCDDVTVKEKKVFIPLAKKGEKIDAKKAEAAVEEVLEIQAQRHIKSYKSQMSRIHTEKKREQRKLSYDSCRDGADGDDDDVDMSKYSIDGISSSESVIGKTTACMNKVDRRRAKACVDSKNRSKCKRTHQAAIVKRCQDMLQKAQLMIIVGKHADAQGIAEACEEHIDNDAIGCELATLNALKNGLGRQIHIGNGQMADFAGSIKAARMAQRQRENAMLMQKTVWSNNQRSNYGQQAMPAPLLARETSLRTQVGQYNIWFRQALAAEPKLQQTRILSGGQRVPVCNPAGAQALIARIEGIANTEFRTAQNLVHQQNTRPPFRYGNSNVNNCNNPFVTYSNSLMRDMNCNGRSSSTSLYLARGTRSLGQVQYSSAESSTDPRNTRTTPGATNSRRSVK